MLVFLFIRSQFTRAFYERDDEDIHNSLRSSVMSFTWSVDSPTKCLRYPFEPVLGKLNVHLILRHYQNLALTQQLPRRATITQELDSSMSLIRSLRRSAYRRAYSALSINPQRFFEINCDLRDILDTVTQNQLLAHPSHWHRKDASYHLWYSISFEPELTLFQFCPESFLESN